MMQLRDYQRAAVDAVMRISCREGERHPLVVLPTGSGKSLVCAAICAEQVEAGSTVAVLTHRKELIEQDARALAAYAPDIRQSVYSASMGQKDSQGDVVFAQIQSIWRDPGVIGQRDLIVIDEAHLLGRDEDSMYGQVIAWGQNPYVSRVGLTATPYRLDSGRLDEGEGHLFDHVAIHVSAAALVAKGYLAPLTGLAALRQADMQGVRVRGGDWVRGEMEEIMTGDSLVQATCANLASHLIQRRAGLVYCVTVAHAEIIAQGLIGAGIAAQVIHGGLTMDDRAARLSALVEGRIKALVNCEVLTTGVDLPCVDTLALLRPTMSKGLHTQILGRGMRLSPGKDACLVLDYVGNCRRHGDLNELGMTEFRDLREEHNEEIRRAAVAAHARTPEHDSEADEDPFAAQSRRDVRVLSRQLYLRPAKVAGKTHLVCEYRTSSGPVRQWVCVEIDGGARHYAERWFRRRGWPYQVPRLASVALGCAQGLPVPETLTVDFSGRWPEVVVEHYRQGEE